MSGPLVSVVTPTWQRHGELLSRCVPSVAAQTYPWVEHVVVSDGPDPVLRGLVPGSVRYAEVEEHDPGARWGHWARLLGVQLASGPVIAWLDDDNAFRPDHVERLVAALDAPTRVDFTYPRMIMHGADGSQSVIGSVVPAYCDIDTSMLVHRRELLGVASWRQGQPTIDWDIVERWLAAGATWRHVPEITVDYYARP